MKDLILAYLAQNITAILACGKNGQTFTNLLVAAGFLTKRTGESQNEVNKDVLAILREIEAEEASPLHNKGLVSNAANLATFTQKVGYATTKYGINPGPPVSLELVPLRAGKTPQTPQTNENANKPQNLAKNIEKTPQTKQYIDFLDLTAKLDINQQNIEILTEAIAKGLFIDANLIITIKSDLRNYRNNIELNEPAGYTELLKDVNKALDLLASFTKIDASGKNQIDNIDKSRLIDILLTPPSLNGVKDALREKLNELNGNTPESYDERLKYYVFLAEQLNELTKLIDGFTPVHQIAPKNETKGTQKDALNIEIKETV